MAYQLTYFNMRGRAEPIRILLAVADVPYVDIRVNYEDFVRLKPSECKCSKFNFSLQI